MIGQAVSARGTGRKSRKAQGPKNTVTRLNAPYLRLAKPSGPTPARLKALAPYRLDLTGPYNFTRVGRYVRTTGQYCVVL